MTFLERTLTDLSAALTHAGRAEYLGRRPGLLQRLDPRAKLGALLALLVAAVVSPHAGVSAAVLALGALLAILSRISLGLLATRVWASVLLFTGVVVLPAVVLTPGPPILAVPGTPWILTATGVRAALRLVARAEAAATLAVLLVLSTPWPRLLEALRALRIPATFVVTLGMSYRYVLLLTGLAAEMLTARRSRLLGPLPGRETRKLAAATAGVLLSKSLRVSGDVYLAMQSRGFEGEFPTLSELRMKALDWAALVGLAAAAGVLVALG